MNIRIDGNTSRFIQPDTRASDRFIATIFDDNGDVVNGDIVWDMIGGNDGTILDIHGVLTVLENAITEPLTITIIAKHDGISANHEIRLTNDPNETQPWFI